MPASEEAYGADHPATQDTYINDEGHEVQRQKNIAKIRAELSELATDGRVGSFEQPEPSDSDSDSDHDHGPDN